MQTASIASESAGVLVLDRPLAPPARVWPRRAPHRRLGEGSWTALLAGCDVLAATTAALAVAPDQADRLAAFPLAVVSILAARGLYGLRRPSVLATLGPLTGAVGLAALAALVIGVILNAAPTAGAIAVLWPAATVAAGLSRAALVLAQRRVRAAPAGGAPVLIVGCGEIGRRVARHLAAQPGLGLRPVGFLDADPAPAPRVAATDPPVLGAPADLATVAAATGARHVLLAFAAEPDSSLASTVRAAAAEHDLIVGMVPRLFDSMTAATTYEPVGGLPLLWLHRPRRGGWQYAVKHASDRVAAGLLLLAVAPLLGLLAALVRWSSPGPALFRQRRVGRDGREFELLKLRSMRVAEMHPRWAPKAGRAPGGIEGADRRTAVGRFLRRTSLDELPQLVNVVRGEMSLVGPRPERPEFVALFEEHVGRYAERHRVRPGMTGWAQVHGLRGGRASVEDRIAWDNFYVEHWSLGLDLRILALTALAVLRAAE